MDEIVSRHTDSAVRTHSGPGGEPVSSRDFQRILEVGMNAWIDAGEGSGAAEAWPPGTSW